MEPFHVASLRWRFRAGAAATALAALAACSAVDEPQAPPAGGKADDAQIGAFPAAGDLALIIPINDARIALESLLPLGWLADVDSALAESELAESIGDENLPDDWHLVSARFVTCAPLGTVADPDELDRVCWPQVRLVLQPIVEDVRVGSTVRPHYADDRAIHALYRVDHAAPELAAMLARLRAGARIADLDPTMLAQFELARDRSARGLLEALAALREPGLDYGPLGVRPELDGRGDADAFNARLRALLGRFAVPTALHELTAFSLPLGRNPAAANLWSFVAFNGDRGAITQRPLAIHDARDGARLFAFPRSEDVTTDVGDPELEDALATMPPDRRAALVAQVVLETSTVPAQAARLNDPYQTPVPTTSCASCHRMTNLSFNFHNLSYFEDQDISVAPRVVADVARDVRLARRLWSSR